MEPLTRTELFLAKAAGQDVPLPEPWTRLEEFLVAINKNIDRLGVQPDLAQNDPTQPDYVKNRTHWVERDESTILEETTLTGENGEMGLEADISLEIGKTYQIVYNGTEYECAMVDGAAINDDTAGMPVCGNIDLLLGTGDNGMPFLLANQPGSAILVVDFTGASTCTVAIYGDGQETVHKLDNKFIDAEWMATRKLGKGAAILEEAEQGFVATTVSGISVAFGMLEGEWKELALGSTYIVVWNGVEYAFEAKANENNVCYYLGNGVCLGGANTGEPFCIYTSAPHIDALDRMTCFIYYNPDELTHTVGIYEAEVVANKLPEEFLPKDYINALIAAQLEEVENGTY